MALPVSAFSTLAWRNLWRNYRRTLIMLIAITVGVWAMIFMTALLRGMVDNMVQQGLNALPGHIQIHATAYMDDPSVNNSMLAPGRNLLAVLNSEQTVGWASRIKVPAMISSEQDNRGITLLGVDPPGEMALGFDINDIVDGRFLDSADDGGIVIGRKLLERLETRLGKRVVVMSQDPDNAIVDRGFRVVGVYKADLESREEGIVYAGRSVIQKMLGVGSDVSEIAVLGHDYREPDALAAKIRNALGNDINGSSMAVRTWVEIDAYLDTMMRVMDGFVRVWVVVMFRAVSFGLVNTLMRSV
ncbi:MAG: ABC transporter permease, partial [Xanthomonadales bacterium]|nr:ABC transporter permease [Xanthomonadales bacterium]